MSTNTTTTPVDDNMLGKIRKLLATAEHPNTPPHEADSAMEMAQRLISKYAIDQAMLENVSPDRDKVSVVKIDVTNPYAGLKCTLMFAVARANRCKAVRSKVGNHFQMTVVGFKSGLDAADLAYTSLLVQLTNAARMCGNTDKNWYKGMASGAIRSFRTSFMQGWVVEVDGRLKEAAKLAQGDAEKYHGESKVALVLVDQSRLVEAELRVQFPNGLRKTSGRQVSNFGAYGQGRTSGKSADIGNRRIGGNVKALGR